MSERRRRFRSSDVPHPRRVADGKGARIGGKNLGGTVPPKAPPICMLYPDLAEGLEPAPVFGQFPRGLIGKILPWLRASRDRVLHVCSGALILADGRALPFADGTIEAVLLDPPYTEHYAKELYGTDYPRPSHLLAEAARVVRPSGRIGFVHYITSNPPAGARFVKCFALSMGFGFPMRCISIYERLALELPGMEAA